MSNSLGLVGDGDELDLVRDVESVFDLRFEDDELTDCLKVGQLYDIVLGRMRRHDRRDRTCLSAATFYRLRQAVRDSSEIPRMGPRTAVLEVKGGLDIREFWAALAEKSDLALPGLHLGRLRFWLATAIFLSPLPVFFVLDPWWLATPLIMVSYLTLRHAPKFAKELPDDCETLGSLAKSTWLLNYGRLAREYGTCRPSEIWNVLVEVLSWHNCEGVDIDAETSFIS